MIPEQQRAVILHAYTGEVIVEDRAVPPPGPGEVLVRIAAASINPSDLAFLQGYYGVRKPLPCVPGFEGSGTVVAVGEGVDEAWIGQRIACFSGDEDGTWTEFARTRVDNCLPVDDEIDLQQAAMLLVNPMTAWALLDQIGGTPAIVQTAAASALGRMIIRLAQKRGIQVINIVRREEQVADLMAMGAAHVLNSSAADFDHRLRELTRELKARVAFDAVGGELATRILRLMPGGSHLIVYGGLGGDSVTVNVGDLIFKNKKVEGFWLVFWIRNAEKRAAAWREIQDDSDIFKSAVRARYPLAEAVRAIADYASNMSGGKVLLTP